MLTPLQRKLARQERQQCKNQACLAHCANVQTCLREIGHLIMMRLPVVDQLRLNQAHKSWYVNVKSDANSPICNGRPLAPLFHRANIIARCLTVIRIRGYYDPLTKQIVAHSATLQIPHYIDEYCDLIERDIRRQRRRLMPM